MLKAFECCFEVHVFVCWEWIEELEWLLLLSSNFFVCLFVGIKPEKMYSASCDLEGSKPVMGGIVLFFPRV